MARPFLSERYAVSRSYFQCIRSPCPGGMHNLPQRVRLTRRWTLKLPRGQRPGSAASAGSLGADMGSGVPSRPAPQTRPPSRRKTGQPEASCSSGMSLAPRRYWRSSTSTPARAQAEPSKYTTRAWRNTCHRSRDLRSCHDVINMKCCSPYVVRSRAPRPNTANVSRASQLANSDRRISVLAS